MDKKQELLTILMEECGEVIQASSKIIRFGETEHNLTELKKEVGDLLAMIDLLETYSLVRTGELLVNKQAKIEKLKIYSNLIEKDVDNQGILL